MSVTYLVVGLELIRIIRLIRLITWWGYADTPEPATPAIPRRVYPAQKYCNNNSFMIRAVVRVANQQPLRYNFG